MQLYMCDEVEKVPKREWLEGLTDLSSSHRYS